ncbi:MAG: class I SAM-dependent methyltransferase [Nanoarchaeota archaeon]
MPAKKNVKKTAKKKTSRVKKSQSKPPITKTELKTLVRQLEKESDVNYDAYESTAEDYYKKMHVLGDAEIHARDEFLSHVRHGGLILDVGCGPGRDAKYFVSQGFRVIGIDMSPKMVRIARREVQHAEFHVMDFLDMEFPNEFADAIWFNSSLLLVEKHYAPFILKEMRDILKPKGIIYISLSEGKGQGVLHDAKHDVKKFYAFYDKKEAELLLKDGFRILAMYDTRQAEFKPPSRHQKWFAILAQKK